MKKIQSTTILAISLTLAVVAVSPIEASAADLKKLADELVNVVAIHQEGDPIPDIDITIDQPQLPDTQRGIEKSDIRRGMRSVQNETTDITIDQPQLPATATGDLTNVFPPGNKGNKKNTKGDSAGPFVVQWGNRGYIAADELTNVRTTDVTGEIFLSEGREMVMPGDNVTVTAKLIVPVALNKGLRFAIREGEAMFEEDDEDMLEKSRIEKQEGTITIMKRLPDYSLNVIEHRMKSGTVKFFNETKSVGGGHVDNAPEEKERGIGKDTDCDGDGYAEENSCTRNGILQSNKGKVDVDNNPGVGTISIIINTPKEPIRVVREIKMERVEDTPKSLEGTPKTP